MSNLTNRKVDNNEFTKSLLLKEQIPFSDINGRRIIGSKVLADFGFDSLVLIFEDCFAIATSYYEGDCSGAENMKLNFEDLLKPRQIRLLNRLQLINLPVLEVYVRELYSDFNDTIIEEKTNAFLEEIS
jgi:hypothetical protein